MVYWNVRESFSWNKKYLDNVYPLIGYIFPHNPLLLVIYEHSVFRQIHSIHNENIKNTWDRLWFTKYFYRIVFYKTIKACLEGPDTMISSENGFRLLLKKAFSNIIGSLQSGCATKKVSVVYNHQTNFVITAYSSFCRKQLR